MANRGGFRRAGRGYRAPPEIRRAERRRAAGPQARAGGRGDPPQSRLQAAGGATGGRHTSPPKPSAERSERERKPRAPGDASRGGQRVRRQESTPRRCDKKAPERDAADAAQGGGRQRAQRAATELISLAAPRRRGTTSPALNSIVDVIAI